LNWLQVWASGNCDEWLCWQDPAVGQVMQRWLKQNSSVVGRVARLAAAIQQMALQVAMESVRSEGAYQERSWALGRETT
jgi:hypothetical protein